MMQQQQEGNDDETSTPFFEAWQQDNYEEPERDTSTPFFEAWHDESAAMYDFSVPAAFGEHQRRGSVSSRSSNSTRSDDICSMGSVCSLGESFRERTVYDFEQGRMVAPKPEADEIPEVKELEEEQGPTKLRPSASGMVWKSMRSLGLMTSDDLNESDRPSIPAGPELVTRQQFQRTKSGSNTSNKGWSSFRMPKTVSLGMVSDWEDDDDKSLSNEIEGGVVACKPQRRQLLLRTKSSSSATKGWNSFRVPKNMSLGIGSDDDNDDDESMNDESGSERQQAPSITQARRQLLQRTKSAGSSNGWSSFRLKRSTSIDKAGDVKIIEDDPKQDKKIKKPVRTRSPGPARNVRRQLPKRTKSAGAATKAWSSFRVPKTMTLSVGKEEEQDMDDSLNSDDEVGAETNKPGRRVAPAPARRQLPQRTKSAGSTMMSTTWSSFRVPKTMTLAVGKKEEDKDKSLSNNSGTPVEEAACNNSGGRAPPVHSRRQPPRTKSADASMKAWTPSSFRIPKTMTLTGGNDEDKDQSMNDGSSMYIEDVESATPERGVPMPTRRLPQRTKSAGATTKAWSSFRMPKGMTLSVGKEKEDGTDSSRSETEELEGSKPVRCMPVRRQQLQLTKSVGGWSSFRMKKSNGIDKSGDDGGTQALDNRRSKLGKSLSFKKVPIGAVSA